MKEGKNFQEVVDIVAKLRKECPWDREQTNQSIKNNLIEEAYELFEAIEENDDKKMLEELGDVLLQVVFHSQIKKDEGKFDINDVLINLKNKLIKRHPHVFGDSMAKTAEEVLKQWHQIKQEEKNSILEGIPKRMPALIRAVKIQNRMAKVGFEWESIDEVWKKVEEELNELKEAKTYEEKKHELGDLLIAITNLARFMNIDPEEALHLSIDRTINRFSYIEQRAKEQNKKVEEMSLKEMDMYWNEAKQKEEMAKRFDIVANKYDTPDKEERSRIFVEKILSLIPVTKDWKVLDLGAGTGTTDIYLSPYVKEIVAFDLSEGMLSVFKEKIEKNIIQNIRIYKKDIFQGDFEEKDFDMIISTMAFHHLDNPKEAINFLKNYIKKGGYLVIVDLDKEDGSFHSDNTDVKHFGFSKDEVIKWFDENEFEIKYLDTIYNIDKEKDGEIRSYPVFMVIAKKR